MGILSDRGDAHKGIHPWADFRIFKTVGISSRYRNGLRFLTNGKWKLGGNGWVLGEII